MKNFVERMKHDLDVSVIVTFENKVEQVCWYITDGWIFNPRFSKYIKRAAPNHTYEGKYLPQKHIMERIYNHLVEEGHDVTDVMKISLSYRAPDYVKSDTTKELWKSGYGYMMKYHQYYFQPDQRGYVAVVDEGGNKVKPNTKGYKRQNCSLYLQQKVYEKLIEISEKNELSISECGQRLMVQSMGMIN